MISREEILKGQICPVEYEDNLKHLLEALNKFRTAYGKPMYVTSGLRSSVHNLIIGGAQTSAHLSAQAADFADTNRDLKNWIEQNINILETCGLWMEDPNYTKTWIHLQIRPASKRVFIP